MKVKIRLDTQNDAINFSNIASQISGDVFITDAKQLKISAKSVMGALYSLEFAELWCESEEDIYTKIQNFIVVE